MTYIKSLLTILHIHVYTHSCSLIDHTFIIVFFFFKWKHRASFIFILESSTPVKTYIFSYNFFQFSLEGLAKDVGVDGFPEQLHLGGVLVGDGLIPDSLSEFF